MGWQNVLCAHTLKQALWSLKNMGTLPASVGYKFLDELPEI